MKEGGKGAFDLWRSDVGCVALRCGLCDSGISFIEIRCALYPHTTSFAQAPDG